MPYTRVKICGVRSAEDLRAAVDAGADAIGFNFHPASPRYVCPTVARELVRQLPPFVEAVGVFVAHTVAQARVILEDTGIRTIQVHGSVLPETIDAFPWRYVPAFQVRTQVEIDTVSRYLVNAAPTAILVDGHVAGLHGGTGQVAPWELLARWRCPVPLILAGGLSPDNVAEAIRAVRPYAVDVASGVESSPGCKDHDKMRRFVEQVRSAC